MGLLHLYSLQPHKFFSMWLHPHLLTLGIPSSTQPAPLPTATAYLDILFIGIWKHCPNFRRILCRISKQTNVWSLHQERIARRCHVICSACSHLWLLFVHRMLIEKMTKLKFVIDICYYIGISWYHPLIWYFFSVLECFFEVRKFCQKRKKNDSLFRLTSLTPWIQPTTCWIEMFVLYLLQIDKFLHCNYIYYKDL